MDQAVSEETQPITYCLLGHLQYKTLKKFGQTMLTEMVTIQQILAMVLLTIARQVMEPVQKIDLVALTSMRMVGRTLMISYLRMRLNG